MLCFNIYCKTVRTDGVVCCGAQVVLLHGEVKIILYNIKTSNLCNKSCRITVFMFIDLSKISDKLLYVDLC